jgi:hypothetical protein
MTKINKKGAEMAIGTLVVIVLAILVLVLIAFGFATGWSNLFDKVRGFFGGAVNVDSLKQACTVACTTQSTFEYCCVTKTINYKEEATGKVLSRPGICTDALIKPDNCEIECANVNCVTKTKAEATAECTAAATAAKGNLADLPAVCTTTKIYADAGQIVTKTCKELVPALCP